MARLSKLSRSIAGKVAIVTGAASGMGRATAHLFADEGAKVAVLDISPVDPVVAEITGAGGIARGWQLDVSRKDDIDRVVAEIAAHFGGIDILVNNAGISLHGAVDTEDFESRWARSLDVLLTAQVRMIRAALPHLRRATDARIVNIASTEALGATRFISPYTAAKSGVVGLTRSLAVEFGPEGITVNCICPGPINTGMTERISQEHKAEYARRRVALRRYAEPEEVAQMTLSLCLPAAGFVTGATLPAGIVRSVDLCCLAARFAQLVDVEAGAPGRLDDHMLAHDDLRSSLFDLRRHVVRNHDSAVLVGVDQIAVAHAHAGDVDGPREIDHVNIGMRRNDPPCQHLESGGHFGQIAHAAVSDQADAAETAVDRAVHLAPESAVAALLVDVLDHDDAGLGAHVDVGVVVV